MNDLISIVVTLYDYERFLVDLIKSCLQQTYKNWELIIVDDASTDNPFNIIQRYQQKIGQDRIKYVRFHENRGYSIAKNEGIIHSEGEYIVMIDGDDMLTEKSLEVRYETLKKYPEALWCHGEAMVLRGRHLSKESHNRKRQLREKYRKEGRDLTTNYPAGLIHAQTVMVRKELHRIVGLYDEDLPFSSDKEMWCRILGLGYIPAHVDKFVAIYRVHPKQMHRQTFKKKNLHIFKPMRLEHTKQRIEQGINAENTRLLED